MKNNNMTTRKALSLGLLIKQSKRFLRVKKSMLIIFNANENLRSLDNIRRIVENSKFELDFNYFGSNYVLSSDGIKYVNFDIMVGENLGVGLIDYKDFIGKVVSMDVGSHIKIKYVSSFISLCNTMGDIESSELGYTILHSIAIDFRHENSEGVLFRKFVKENPFNLNFVDGRRNRWNIPDGWALIDGHECPIEAKKNEFDSRALIQLQRYMNVFGSRKGIAVASSLNVELPDNIFFYNINGKKEN